MRAEKLAQEYAGLGPWDMDQLDHEAIERPQWEPDAVRAAMVDAYRVLLSTVRRPGPGSLKSFWPGFPAEALDIWEQRREGTNALGRDRAQVQVTAVSIARSDRALRWPLQYLADDYQLRNMFQAWAFGQSIGLKGQTLCRKRGWPYSTLRERRDRASRIIAQGLNKELVSPW